MEIHWHTFNVPKCGYAVKKKFVGEWRIVESDEWSPDYLDMIKEAEIKITTRGTGHINFGAFEGMIDAEKDEWNPEEVIQFSFYGRDEDETVSGRGTAKIIDEEMIGRIVFHCGMKAKFRATKKPKI
ncbi:hypothetical protein MLD52_23040 [Puniceicoccaceae bacterium K14]|nr:hypothetical protein [Puniceicoccaceae bacterium K14]